MTVQYQIREVFLRKYVERKCNVGFYLGDDTISYVGLLWVL